MTGGWLLVIMIAAITIYLAIRNSHKIRDPPAVINWAALGFTFAAGVLAFVSEYATWKGPSLETWANHANAVCVQEIDSVAARSQDLADWYRHIGNGQLRIPLPKDYLHETILYSLIAKDQRRLLARLQEIDQPRDFRSDISNTLADLSDSSHDFRIQAGEVHKVDPNYRHDLSYAVETLEVPIYLWLAYGIPDWNRSMSRLDADDCILPNLERKIISP